MVQHAGQTPPSATLAPGSWAHLVACSRTSCLGLPSERRQRLCWTEPQNNLTPDPNPHYNPFLQSQLTQPSPPFPSFFFCMGVHITSPHNGIQRWIGMSGGAGGERVGGWRGLWGLLSFGTPGFHGEAAFQRSAGARSYYQAKWGGKARELVFVWNGPVQSSHNHIHSSNTLKTWLSKTAALTFHTYWFFFIHLWCIFQANVNQIVCNNSFSCILKTLIWHLIPPDKSEHCHPVEVIGIFSHNCLLAFLKGDDLALEIPFGIYSIYQFD